MLFRPAHMGEFCLAVCPRRMTANPCRALVNNVPPKKITEANTEKPPIMLRQPLHILES